MPATIEVADPMDQPGYCTVLEAAEYLCLGRSKVYEMMDSGQLPHAKFGRARRLRRQDVKRLADESLIGTQDD